VSVPQEHRHGGLAHMGGGIETGPEARQRGSRSLSS
jgi:hypothetical protein